MMEGAGSVHAERVARVRIHVGMQAEPCCVALIESEAPDAYTLIVRPADYDFHRVIIRVDSDSLVTKTPSRG